jgi:hypothetical protein
MPDLRKAVVDTSKFNPSRSYPYNLRQSDFQRAMEDLYDFFFDINTNLVERGLQRFDDLTRPAALSGILSDLITDSLAKASRALVSNTFHNGHPDLVVKGRYPRDSVEAGTEGIEVKSTRGSDAVDTHAPRNEWMCVWVYDVDNDPDKTVYDRDPLTIRRVFLAEVTRADFRFNDRGPNGTRTYSLHRDGLRVLRDGWVYVDEPAGGRRGNYPWRQPTP